MTKRIVHALLRNCRAYTDGGRSYQNFHNRACRLWRMAEACGCEPTVRNLVTPPLMAAYPRWARETGLSK